jgi:hypothetical protein
MLMYAYNKKPKKANIIFWQIREKSEVRSPLPTKKIRQNISELKKSSKPTRNYRYQAFFCALVFMQISAQKYSTYLDTKAFVSAPSKKASRFDYAAIVYSFAHPVSCLHFYENFRQKVGPQKCTYILQKPSTGYFNKRTNSSVSI